MPKKLSRFVLLLLAVIMMLQIAGVASAEAIDSEDIIWSSPGAVSLRGARIRATARGDYNGEPHKLMVTVTFRGDVLVEGRDFVIANHRTLGSNARRYRVKFVVIGIGRYKGFVTKTVNYRINRIDQTLTVTHGGATEIEVSYQDLRLESAGPTNNNRFALAIVNTGFADQAINSRLVWRRPSKIKIRNVDGAYHIYLPKNLRKGTYTVTVYARAGGNYKKSLTQKLLFRVMDVD